MKIIKIALILTLVLFAFSCKKKPTELLPIDEPIINPASGTYYAGQAITLTCPEFGATIRYTNDGTEPNEQSTIYTSPLLIPTVFPDGATSATIKARSYKSGFNPSETVTANYSVTFFSTVAIPHFSPPGGDISTATEITIICTTLNAALYYTLDGSDPTPSSPLYTGTFTISQPGAVTLKARGYRAGWNPSSIASINYNVTAK